MKAPTDLIWEIIGDAFQDAIVGDQRRPVEGLWQKLQRTAADTLRYQQHLKDLRNIFDATAFADYAHHPGHVVKSESSPPIPARVIGGYYSGSWIWYLWVSDENYDRLPESGHVKVGNRTVPYSSFSQSKLQTGGYVIKVGTFSAKEKAQTINQNIADGPSHSFEVALGDERWDHPEDIQKHPQGVYYEIDSVDYDELRDLKYLNGGEDFKAIFDFEVWEWSRYADMVFFSYSDVDEFAMEITETKNDVFKFLINDGTQTEEMRVVGDQNKIADSLRNATEGNPTPVEMIIEYDASAGTMKGKAIIDGEKVEQKGTLDIRPGRRTHRLGFTNEDRTSPPLRGLLENFVVSEGSLWSGEQPPDAAINEDFPFQFVVDAPIVESDRIWTAPWDIKIKAKVLSHENGVVEVETQENYAGYIPEYARIQRDNGDFYILEQKSDTEFEVIETNTARQLKETVTIRPLFLNSDEFSWPQTSHVNVEFDIDPDILWLEGAGAREVDLYGRYGELLDATQRPDSKEYLQLLRGMQIGILSSPSPKYTEHAIDIMLGAPFAPEEGTLTDIEPVKNSAGVTEYYEATVGGQTVDVPAHLEEHLRPIGWQFEKFESLVDGTQVFDWFNDDEGAMKQAFPSDTQAIWAKWGTFLVRMPEYYGINEEIADEIFTVLNRSKNKNRDYKLLIHAGNNDEDERIREDQKLSENSTNTRVDMVFDMYRSVANNPIYSAPEDDSGTYAEMGHTTLDDGRTLADDINRIPYTHNKVGQVLGERYSREEKVKEDEFDYEFRSINLLRGHESHENSSFGRPQARIGDKHTPHPTSMCYVYEAGGDTLADYDEKEFNAGETLSGSILGLWVGGYDNIVTVNSSGKIYESDDYMQSFVEAFDHSSSFFSVDGKWASTKGKYAKKESGAWSIYDTPFSGDFYGIATNNDESVIVMCGEFGEFYYSTDGGSSWSSNNKNYIPTNIYYSEYYDSFFITTETSTNDEYEVRQVQPNGDVINPVQEGVNGVSVDESTGTIYSVDDDGYLYSSDDPSTSGYTSVDYLSSDGLNCIDVDYNNKFTRVLVGTGSGFVHTYNPSDSSVNSYDPNNLDNAMEVGLIIPDGADFEYEFWKVAIDQYGDNYRWK